MFSERKRYQIKYARDQRMLAKAFQILQQVSRDYNLHFGAASFESYADGCRLRLFHAYEDIAKQIEEGPK